MIWLAALGGAALLLATAPARLVGRIFGWLVARSQKRK